MTPEAYNKIKTFLDLPEVEMDYHKGIALYKEFGDNYRLKNVIFLPERKSPGVMNTLCYELGKLIKEFKPGKKSTVKKVEVAPEPEATEEVIEENQEDPKPEVKTVKIQSTEQSLRSEFPKIVFAELPDELKILVIDRISLHTKAREAHDKALVAKTDKERFEWNKIQNEAMMENQEIWAELNYFEANKKVLGKHRAFDRKNELEKLQKLNREELFKLKKNFPSKISKANKAIRENKDKDEICAKKRKLLEKYEWMEKEVDRLLGI